MNEHDHKVGPPFRANAPSKSISVRLTDAELAILDAHVEKRGEGASRSGLIREAMMEQGLFTPPRKRG